MIRESIEVPRLMSWLRRNPGATCAQVADAFGVTCPLAGHALRGLRLACVVTSRGNTRGTRYYARKGAR